MKVSEDQQDYGAASASTTSGVSVGPFDEAIARLCITLENWTAERAIARAASLEEFPPLNRRAALQGLIFAVLFGVSLAEEGFLRGTSFKIAYLVAVLAGLVSFVAGTLLFFLEAPGLTTRRFWRAVFCIFKKDNYPFTQLHGFLSADLAAAAKLSPYSLSILEAGEKRIAAEESDLRERLQLGVGHPSLVLVVGILAAISSAWTNLNKEESMLNIAVFFGSITALALALKSMKLRVALLELARCRGLLALEIARRKASNASRNPV